MIRILVWDSPNMNRAIDELLGHQALSAERPRMDRILNWFVRAASTTEDTVIAGVFANIRPDNAGFHKFQAWLRFLSSIGWHVGVKAKDDEASDVDEMMVAFIDEHLTDVREVIIASHDAVRFIPVIERLGGLGIKVTVLGYAELANGYSSLVHFKDIESITGAFKSPLPRHIPIANLPTEGMIFEPSGQPRATSRRTQAKRVHRPVSPPSGQ